MSPLIRTLLDRQADRVGPVYNALLSHTKLSRSDSEYLEELGMPKVEPFARGYRTMPGRTRIGLARALLKTFGWDRCREVPGLYFDSESRRWSITGKSGLIVPVRNFDGVPVALAIRAIDYDGEPLPLRLLTSAHKGGPDPGHPVHVPLFRGSSLDQVALTDEDILFADLATYRTGVLHVAVHQSKNWEAALPILRLLPIRELIVRFSWGCDNSRATAFTRLLRNQGIDWTVSFEGR